jgi:putative sugar O-methyltransferase
MSTNWNVNSRISANYLSVCKEASTNENIFNEFKRNLNYTSILEHATKQNGEIYADYILNNNPKLLEFSKFFENDLYGSPLTYNYGFQNCSPTTLCYIHILCRLIQKLNTLENFKIVEIGGGYGGQAKIITDYFNIKQYDIIDLKEATLLQSKYIEKLNIPNTQVYTSDTYDKNNTYDLVISCYALTEVIEPLQTEYVNSIVLNSKHGFISCNGPIHSIRSIENKFADTIQRFPIETPGKIVCNTNTCYLVW